MIKHPWQAKHIWIAWQDVIQVYIYLNSVVNFYINQTPSHVQHMLKSNHIRKTRKLIHSRPYMEQGQKDLTYFALYNVNCSLYTHVI